MSKRNGKNSFYKKLKIDKDTWKVINFYNDCLDSWRSNKKLYVDEQKLKESLEDET